MASTPMENPFTSKDLADFIYNNKLPEVYVVMDELKSKNKDLYRFLQACYQGGFKDTIEKAVAMKRLVDPLTCPEEFLPYLFKSWGLPYFEDIGVYYNRKFLDNIGTFIKIRGTMGGTRYIIRALTGFESELEYVRETTEDLNGRYLYVTLVTDNLLSVNEMEVSTYTISRFLQEHMPFYIRVVNRGVRVEKSELFWKTNINILAMGEHYHYDLSFKVVDRTLNGERKSLTIVGSHVNYDLTTCSKTRRGNRVFTVLGNHKHYTLPHN